MPETVEVGDTEVEIRETEDGFEAVEKEDGFIEYLKSNETPFYSNANTFHTDTRYGGDAVVEYGYFSPIECEYMSESDDVKIDHIRTSGEAVVVELEDTR